MKLAALAPLTALALAAASPADVPSGVPATSGLPFSTLSFDTTAAPSLLSALSSLISSESTAVTPHTTTWPVSSGNISATTATPTPTAPSVTSSVAPTNTSAARRLGDRTSVGVGLVLGAIAALVC